MSTSAAVASEFLRVQNASEANRTVVNGSTNLISVPEKQLGKTRLNMQDLSRIKPQMMEKVLSSIGLSEDKKSDFVPVNRQDECFDGQSEASSHREMLELFPVSIGSGFGSNPRVSENKIIFPFAIGQTNTESRFVPAKALEQQSTAQLTIFYKGAMNVYEMPTEKAQAIMRLASANSSNNTRTATLSSIETEHISKSRPSKPASKDVNENQLHRAVKKINFIDHQ